MLIVNVYYFFIRRWCLPGCLVNLVKLPNGTLSHKSQRLAIELLMIAYLSGVQLVPGGHQQFQMWYWDLIPFAIEMVGLPSILTFKLFQDIYPCDLTMPNTHHIFSIGLSAYLLTVGTNFWSKIGLKFY